MNPKLTITVDAKNKAIASISGLVTVGAKVDVEVRGIAANDVPSWAADDKFVGKALRFRVTDEMGNDLVRFPIVEKSATSDGDTWTVVQESGEDVFKTQTGVSGSPVVEFDTDKLRKAFCGVPFNEKLEFGVILDSSLDYAEYAVGKMKVRQWAKSSEDVPVTLPDWRAVIQEVKDATASANAAIATANSAADKVNASYAHVSKSSGVATIDMKDANGNVSSAAVYDGAPGLLGYVRDESTESWHKLTCSVNKYNERTLNVENTAETQPDQGNVFVKATGSTTSRTLADRFADVVNVKDFGAKGDGTTDDTSAIQAALNKRGLVFIPSGIYRCADKLTVGGNTRVVMSDDAEIRFVSAYSEHSGIKAAGPGIGSTSISVTADVAYGSKTVGVSDASSISVGDWVLICDDKRSGSRKVDGVTVYFRAKSGEMHRVTSKTATSITLEDGVWTDFAVSRNAFVRKVSIVENVSITGGAITGTGVESDNQNVGILMSCVSGFSICDVRLSGFRNHGINIMFCTNGSVERCRFDNIFGSSLGYSISACASQWIVTSACSSSNCGKLWDTGGGEWYDGDTLMEYGWSRFMTCRDCSATGCTRGAISTHEPTDFVTIDNNSVQVNGTQEFGAIYIRSLNCSITNNNVNASGISSGGSMLNGIMVDTMGHNGTVAVSGNKVVCASGACYKISFCENWWSGQETSDVSTLVPSVVSIVGNYGFSKSSNWTSVVRIDGRRNDNDGSVLMSSNSFYSENNTSVYGISIYGNVYRVSLCDCRIRARHSIIANSGSTIGTLSVASCDIDGIGGYCINNAGTVVCMTVSGCNIRTTNSNPFNNVPSRSLWQNNVLRNGTWSVEGEIETRLQALEG